uniref:Uncharacterized protein n=1 Tax=Amphora coffeiformis TaxID=265554 RepID=A0A7S3LGB6_9STRA|eukprot:scaffold3421_cov181-Amphora_coffeaeformis.AAC.6
MKISTAPPIVSLVLGLVLLQYAAAFSPSLSAVTTHHHHQHHQARHQILEGQSLTRLRMAGEDELEKTFGGYTAKQRLREEVESPFRTFRLFFFGSSTGSALVALYFSFLTVAKATAGYGDAPPLDDALQSVGINVIALLVCGGLTYRDWKAGEVNLARIKQGGALAKLVVERQDNKDLATLSDYRRNSRVLLAAGGREYIAELCRSLNADQLNDSNIYPAAMAAADVILVPVLLEKADAEATRVGDTAGCWMSTKGIEGRDRNFDVSKAQSVVGFPRGPAAWADVMEPEVNTAAGQGFDVLEKGITLILKKNGKILRRATGQPQWGGLLGTMDVMDGTKFGMPGDDEIYGKEKASTASSASSD